MFVKYPENEYHGLVAIAKRMGWCQRSIYRRCARDGFPLYRCFTAKGGRNGHGWHYYTTEQDIQEWKVACRKEAGVYASQWKCAQPQQRKRAQPHEAMTSEEIIEIDENGVVYTLSSVATPEPRADGQMGHAPQAMADHWVPCTLGHVEEPKACPAAAAAEPGGGGFDPEWGRQIGAVGGFSARLRKIT